jgi:hypothetical protein
METVETNRKLCLKQQTALRRMLVGDDQHQEALQLLLCQHAMLHSAKMAQTGLWSFEDEILDDLTEGQFRRIPRNCDHSIAWNIWHIARIEDVAMNLLVASSPQIFNQDNWLEQMKISIRDTGNAMSKEGIVDLSATIDIETLRAYRVAVGRKTREIIEQLQPEDLIQGIDPSRLEQVMVEGAVVEAASGLIDYWGRRNIAGLLLMPATRHNLVHLNESLQLKRKRK